MMDLIKSQLEQKGHKAFIVSVGILEQLKKDLLELKETGILNDSQRHIVENMYNFELPKVDFEIKSIILVAKQNYLSRLIFSYKGNKIPVMIPPGYNDYMDAPSLVEGFLREVMGQEGYHCCATPALPNKLLAVRSGFAKYGRNNIVYVEGLGSFCQIYPFYSDLPTDSKIFSEIAPMAMCAKCGACVRCCPTGALLEERFLMDNMRCLTFFNEKGNKPFPEWINSSAHNAIYGCTCCQEVCPQNKEQLKKQIEETEFTEEETLLLLEGKELTSLPELLKKKIRKVNMELFISAVPRNLEVLFK